MNITSDYGYIHLPFFYVGWRNIHRPPMNENDCGDEIFGISLGNYYIGFYEDGKWCRGFLDENEAL